MIEIAPNVRANQFLAKMKSTNPIYWKQINRTAQTHPELFFSLSEPLLECASKILGTDWETVLIKGYIDFVNDVNHSQAIYESSDHYQYSTFSEVAKITYGSPEFMKSYHWGVFVTTFAWEHHLLLTQFFYREFVSRLQKNGRGEIIDFGTGSGVWLTLALEKAAQWQGYGIDISPTSVEWAKSLTHAANLEGRVEIFEGDALKFKPSSAAQAAISCFVLEHLESPLDLLININNAIELGAPAFVCGALTAAEIDHIYEFKRESDLVGLAEEAGFRVVSIFSSAPNAISNEKKYLPRSMAMLLEKRRGEWW